MPGKPGWCAVKEVAYRKIQTPWLKGLWRKQIKPLRANEL